MLLQFNAIEPFDFNLISLELPRASYRPGACEMSNIRPDPVLQHAFFGRSKEINNQKGQHKLKVLRC